MLLLILSLVTASIFILVIPAFIVAEWKTHAVLSYFVASVVVFLTLSVIGILAIRSPNTYSEFGPSDVWVFIMIGLVTLLPALALIQWFARRK